MTKDDLEQKIKEFCDEEYLNEKVQKTVIDYRNCLSKFIEFVDDNFEINKILSRKYKEYLEDKLRNNEYSVASVNKYIVIYNKFLRYLDLKDVQLKQFRSQQKSSLDNQMSNQEHKRMLRKAKEMGEHELYMIIKVFAQSAARVSELKYLTFENIQKGPYIDIFSKGKERKLILIGDLHRELKKYCKENNITEGFIFRSPDSKRRDDPTKMIDTSTIWRHLKKIGGVARVNLNHIHAHGWRHLFAIEYLKLPGATEAELSDILGHTKVETTRIYTRTTLKEKKERMEMIKF